MGRYIINPNYQKWLPDPDTYHCDMYEVMILNPPRMTPIWEGEDQTPADIGERVRFYLRSVKWEPTKRGRATYRWVWTQDLGRDIETVCLPLGKRRLSRPALSWSEEGIMNEIVSSLRERNYSVKWWCGYTPPTITILIGARDFYGFNRMVQGSFPLYMGREARIGFGDMMITLVEQCASKLNYSMEDIHE